LSQIDLIRMISLKGSSLFGSLNCCRCGCWCGIGTVEGTATPPLFIWVVVVGIFGSPVRPKHATAAATMSILVVLRESNVFFLLLIIGVYFVSPIGVGGRGGHGCVVVTINGISTFETESPAVPGTTEGVGVVPGGSNCIAIVLRLVIDGDA